MDASASPVLRQIADAAWRDTARLAVSALSRRGGALGDVGRSLERTLDLGALPGGAAALAQHLAERAPEGVRAALVEALDWELHTFRGGRKVETSHRLEPIEPGPVMRAEIPLEQSGFDAEVTAMDLAAPHSMGDLSRYANAYLGHTFVNDAVENDRIVELHNGSAEEAMAALHARGASSFHQLATPKLHFQLLLTQIDGGLRWAIACDDGPDMFRHLAKVLRAARSSGGRRIDPARVSRFDHRHDEASYRASRLRRCFESSGAMPRQVTVGFKNALLGALAARAERVAQVRALQAAHSLPGELAPLRDIDARTLLRSALCRAQVDALFERAKAAGLGELWADVPGVKRARTRSRDSLRRGRSARWAPRWTCGWRPSESPSSTYRRTRPDDVRSNRNNAGPSARSLRTTVRLRMPARRRSSRVPGWRQAITAGLVVDAAIALAKAEIRLALSEGRAGVQRATVAVGVLCRSAPARSSLRSACC